MTSVDKAAAAWTIAIVAVALALTGAIAQSGDSPTPVQQTASQTTMQEPKEMAQPKMTEDLMAKEEKPAVVKDEPKPKEPTGPKTVMVSVPAGTSVPGCEETDKCYIKSSVSIKVGDTVTWTNDDTAAHTVSSGTPVGGPDGIFDSSLFMSKAKFSVTFDKAGMYPYFCMVHPWMTGTVSVS